MAWITIRYEREKLYEQVWAEPVTKVAKVYGVSDVALRKTCKKLLVPLPPAGYWAKVAAGKTPRKPQLPKFSGPTELLRNRYVSDEPVEPTPPEPAHLIERREYEARSENKIVVANTLTEPHPLVAALQKSWGRKREPDQRGWAQVAVLRRLDVSMSDTTAPRAFCILDALVKGLAKRGMPIRIDGQGSRNTYVSVHGEDISFRLVEKAERTERPLTPDEIKARKKGQLFYVPNRYTYSPTGILSLAIAGGYGTSRTVSDGKNSKIESKLNDFVVLLEHEAVHRRLNRELRERQAEKWAEEARERQIIEIRKSEERQKLAAIEEEIKRWRRAQELRAFVLATETKAIEECGKISAGSELDQWAVWVRKKADEIDPLCNIQFK